MICSSLNRRFIKSPPARRTLLPHDPDCGEQISAPVNGWEAAKGVLLPRILQLCKAGAATTNAPAMRAGAWNVGGCGGRI